MILKPNIIYVGMQNPALRVFDVIMKTEYGTSYNAFLVLGEKKALIETVHDKYTDNFIEKIEENVSISELDYIILNHTEPDHSGSLKKLLEINPSITIVGTTSGIMNLKNIMNIDFKSQVVKQGDCLDLGNDMILDFIIAPNLHWPDSMFTYYKKEAILFSCDVFGCHFCEPLILDTHIKYIDKYEIERKNYYDSIMMPFQKFVVDGLEKIKNLQIDMICCSHGPVLVDRVEETINLYTEWATPKEIEEYTAIFYVSAYGYTRKIAEIIENTLQAEGIKTKIFDLLDYDLSEMADEMNNAKGVAFGSPTINRDALLPIWELICRTEAINVKSKPALIFGSFGWSGEGCGLLSDRLKGLKYKVHDEFIRVKFMPSEAEIVEIQETAKEFAKNLK